MAKEKGVRFGTVELDEGCVAIIQGSSMMRWMPWSVMLGGVNDLKLCTEKVSHLLSRWEIPIIPHPGPFFRCDCASA